MNDAKCKVKKLFQTSAKIPSIIGFHKNPNNETEVFFLLSVLHNFFSRWQFVEKGGCFSLLGVLFQGRNDIGVFSKLTNKYCLIADGGSETFYDAFMAELADQIPVIKTSITGCRYIGRVTAGTECLVFLTL